MPEQVLLGEVAQVVDCEHKTARAARPGTEFGYSIGTPNLTGGRIDFSSAKRVDRETFNEWSRRALPGRGDLILAREAPVGQVAYIDGTNPVCLGQRTVLIRSDCTRVDSRYLHYRLLGPDVQSWMSDRSAGSTVPHLNVADVRQIPLANLPSIQEQRRIAGALSVLDDLIDVNRSSARRVESLAAALASTSAAEVPIAEIASVATVRQFRPNGLVDHFSIPAYDEDRLPERIEGDSIKSGKLLLTQPAVLVSRLNPQTPRVWMAYPSDVPAAASTEFVPLAAAESVAVEEVWAVCAADEFAVQMRARVTGTTGSHQRVDKAALPGLMVADVRRLDPTKRTAIVSLVHEAHASLVGAAEAAKTRDELLPLLLSGQVRVLEAAA